jgi:hypothetical protein
MTSIFDQFPDRREELYGGPGEPPTAPLPIGADPSPRAQLDADPFPGSPFGAAVSGEATRPRRDRTRPRRALVAVGSLTAGAVAASGAAFALSGGAKPELAYATVAGGGASAAATQQGGDDGGDDAEGRKADQASRDKGRRDKCVRLDAKALAAIDAARKAGTRLPGSAAGGSLRVRTDKGDVVLPLSAVKVVSCSWPKPKGSASKPATPGSSTKPSATASTSSSRPKPSSSSSSSAPAPKPTTSSSAPKPKATTTTQPAPKPTTTTPKPAPTTSSGS